MTNFVFKISIFLENTDPNIAKIVTISGNSRINMTKSHRRFLSEIRGVKFIWEKVRGLKIYPEKIRGLKTLGFSEENTPGGYSSLKMTTPLISLRRIKISSNCKILWKSTWQLQLGEKRMMWISCRNVGLAHFEQNI